MFYNNGYNQDWSTLKKLVWLRGNPATGQIGTDLTVSGTPPLSLPNSLGKPLKAWEVDVLPKQDLHGYDAPWPAGGGKNKLKPSFIQGSAISLGRADRIVSDTYIPVTQGLTYTFSADNYSDFYYVLNTGENNTLPIDGSFQYCGNSADWANQDITFTATASGYMWVVIRNTDANNIVPSDVASVKMQVEIGLTATSFAPYENICPIHGTDKLTITSAGKNLLEPKFYGNVAYNQSVGGKAISTSPQDVTSQVTVNGNTYSRSGTAWGKPMSMILDVHAFVGSSLTLSGSTDEYGTGMRFGWYVTSEDYTVISRSGDWTRPVSNTFNIQTGDYYIILYINSAGSADAHITEPMIEVGITSTPYTPYLAPSQTVIDMPPLSANQWDEEWELGDISGTTGEYVDNVYKYILSKNFIPVNPDTEYCITSTHDTGTSSRRWVVYYYDTNGGFITYVSLSNIASTFTTPQNCGYIKFRTNNNSGTQTYNHDISVNYPSTVTTYNPFNNTVYTGTIGSDGGESRWGEVDLGTLTWTYMTHRTNPHFMATIPEMKSVSSNAGNTNVMCEGFTRYAGTGLFNTADINSGFNCTSWEMGSNNHNLVIVWKDYTTVADFTTAVTGMKLIFELTEPIRFPLTAPTIPTPAGTATTWATAEDGTVDGMEVTYVGKA